MAVRAAELYVSWSVRHCLRLLAQGSGGKVTSDAIAERILSDVLQDQYPDVWQFVQEQQQREEAMVAQLAAQKPPTKKKGAA